MSLKIKIESALKEKGPMTHEDLAVLFNAPVPSVRRSLQQLVRAGTVKYKERKWRSPLPPLKVWHIPSAEAPATPTEQTPPTESAV